MCKVVGNKLGIAVPENMADNKGQITPMTLVGQNGRIIVDMPIPTDRDMRGRNA